jgi:hypothetical protein
LNRKYAIWLLCLFLAIAAVDTIPDPPAIFSHGGQNCGVYSFSIRSQVTPLEKEWALASGPVLRDLIHGFSIRLVFDNEPHAVCTLPLVHHETDASPPVCS